MSSWSVSTTTSRSGTPGPGERPSKSASGGSPKGTALRRPRADEGGTRQSDDATHEQEGRQQRPPAHAQPPDRHGGRPLLRPLPSHRSGRHPDGSGSVGGLEVSEGFEHRPVMLDEIVELFRPVPPGLIVDATVGGGGHARALLDALPRHRLLGLDRDEEALVAANVTLAGFEDRVTLRRARFDRLKAMVKEAGDEAVVAVLFDLGVSSPQVDRADRGFSYSHDGPLDMRMDRTQSLTAADVLNTYPVERLTSLLYDYGDERFAGRVARAIVAARPLTSTTQLVDVIRSAIPAPARRRGGHPAKRTFQALRIEVNAELDVLGPALDQAIDVLVPGGHCAVLAYHSGEDRIVKDRFRQAESGGCVCPPGMPCVCGAQPVVRFLRRGVRRPSTAEIATNPRAESARLPPAEKLEPEAAA